MARPEVCQNLMVLDLRAMVSLIYLSNMSVPAMTLFVATDSLDQRERCRRPHVFLRLRRDRRVFVCRLCARVTGHILNENEILVEAQKHAPERFADCLPEDRPYSVVRKREFQEP
jgi:hypothetical protein